MKNGKSKLVLVAGGAGFLGSHLCDALLGRRRLTSSRSTISRPGESRTCAISSASRASTWSMPTSSTRCPPRLRSGRMKIDEIFNLACAASPPHYQADPEHTMLTSVVGTHNLLTFAEETGARFCLASTSEIYGDPEVHPQTETYWGNVNPDRPARLLRRGQARRRDPDLRFRARPAAPTCASRGSSTPTVRACAPTTAASSRT